MKFTTIALSAILATSGAAFAASHGGALDADGDGMLNEAEFEPVAAMGADMAGIDSDGDGMVSQAEYNDAARTLADADANGELDADEFTKYDELTRQFNQAAADREAIDFGTADSDGSGSLNDDERRALDSDES